MENQAQQEHTKYYITFAVNMNLIHEIVQIFK